MRKFVSLMAALALALPTVALAGDLSPFQALSQIAAEESVMLTPMTDEQLASIEGEQTATGTCVACFALNIATVTQVNVAAASAATQTNASNVTQRIRQGTARTGS